MSAEKEAGVYGDDRMIARSLAALGALVAISAGLGACSPTVTVDVKPITIYAKLDADVRLRLDEEVKALIQKNPNLF